MKKILFTSVMCLMIAGTLNVQASDLNAKIKQMQNIQELTKQNDTKSSQIKQLSQKMMDIQFKLDKALETVRTNNITIESLTKNNETLRKQKSSLEAQTLKNQQDTNNNYTEEVHKYQLASNKNISDMLEQFNVKQQKLQQEKADMQKDYEAQIQAMRTKHAEDASKAAEKHNEERSKVVTDTNAQVAELNASSTDLNNDLLNTKKELENARHQVAMNEETIKSVNTIVGILTAQKKSLEEDLSNTQSNTIESYKKQIADINTKAQEEINKYKDHSKALEAANEESLEKSKREYLNKTETDKELYREKIKALINHINNYEDTLNSAVSDISKNANQIDAVTKGLHKAYKYIPAPSLKKSKMGSMMSDIGLSSKGPSWEAVSSEVNSLKDNLASIKKISSDLGGDNLTNKNILSGNKDSSGGWFFGLF